MIESNEHLKEIAQEEAKNAMSDQEADESQKNQPMPVRHLSDTDNIGTMTREIADI